MAGPRRAGRAAGSAGRGCRPGEFGRPDDGCLRLLADVPDPVQGRGRQLERRVRPGQPVGADQDTGAEVEGGQVVGFGLVGRGGGLGAVLRVEPSAMRSRCNVSRTAGWAASSRPAGPSPATAAVVVRTTGAADRSSAAMLRRVSARAPNGQASTQHSRPTALPVSTSTTRISASRHVTGAICANAVETTRVNSPCAQAGPSRGPTAKAISIIGTSRYAYTSVARPAPMRSRPAASAPASVPTTAARTADQVAPAVVRPRVSTVSSTQKPCDRSSEPATRRASARPNALRSAFWKTTERRVRLPVRRMVNRRTVGIRAYQNCSRGRPYTG